MPIYEYECSEHGRFEKLQRGFDPDGACPECGQEAFRLVSNISLKPKSFRGTRQRDWALQNSVRENQELGRLP